MLFPQKVCMLRRATAEGDGSAPFIVSVDHQALEQDFKKHSQLSSLPKTTGGMSEGAACSGQIWPAQGSFLSSWKCIPGVAGADVTSSDLIPRGIAQEEK